MSIFGILIKPCAAWLLLYKLFLCIGCKWWPASLGNSVFFVIMPFSKVGTSRTLICMSVVVAVGNGFPPLSHSPPFGFVAATPPRMFDANIFDHVVVTLGPQHIEEDVSNSVRKISIGHLEAGSKPFITWAVHGGVGCPVVESVHRLSGWDVLVATEVVLPTARIRSGVGPKLMVLLSTPSFSAPVGSRHSHHGGDWRWFPFSPSTAWVRPNHRFTCWRLQNWGDYGVFLDGLIWGWCWVFKFLLMDAVGMRSSLG